MDIQTGNPEFAWLCLFGIVVVALAIWSGAAHKRAAARFALAPMRKRLVPDCSKSVGLMSTTLVVLSVVFLGLALMDLRWGTTSRKVPQKGIEVMFALDVSRSMLAEDAAPNRLGRAKQQIKDMADEMAGDRIGLVVFAGSAKRAVPLTSHYDDFKKILDSVGPHTVPRGGSRLGVAIQEAADGFIDKTNNHKTIVLFTDGEDQESHPLELARKLHTEEGMRIFTVGLGDTGQGARIPQSSPGDDQFLKHQGQQVWSKLNGQVLRALATETDGAYIPAGTKRVNMADVYHHYVASVQQTEFETAKINTAIPRFQWFASAALLLLLLECFLARDPLQAGLLDVTQRRSTHGANTADPPAPIAPLGSYRQGAAGTAAILLCLKFTAGAAAQEALSVAEKINMANQYLRENNVAQALESFQDIDDQSGQYQDLLNYNLAVAHYRNEDVSAAQALFAISAQSADTAIAAAGRYNLGNCHYSKALEVTKQDRQTAIDQLQSAITYYRSSLRLNADNADARANIELAKQLMEQLQKEQEQQQQNQDEQNQNEQNQNEQNQNEQNQNEQNQNEQNQNEQNQNEQNQNEQNQNEQNQDGKNQDQDGSDQPQNSGQQDQGSQSPKPQSQQGNRQQQNQRDAESAAAKAPKGSSSETPTGDLTAVNDDQDVAHSSESLRAAVTGEMTREEALKMLQSVRDRDLLRRLHQQQRKHSRRVHVDKDW
ncbi:MAG: VWA domain-containing protein [Pirellulales bacterium]|nr:VWA domain-containing protein [Pirellulales bacterium]